MALSTTGAFESVRWSLVDSRMRAPVHRQDAGIERRIDALVKCLAAKHQPQLTLLAFEIQPEIGTHEFCRGELKTRFFARLPG